MIDKPEEEKTKTAATADAPAEEFIEPKAVPSQPQRASGNEPESPEQTRQR